MKKAIHLLLAVMAFHILLLATGCKKDKKDANKDPKGNYSFSNTEYTGTARVGNHYYPRPLSIRFGEGDDVSAWSYLTLNQWHRGEIPGKITKVDVDAQGQTQVTVLFDLPGEDNFNSPQVFTISADKSKITGGTAPIIVMVDMKLFPKVSPSIVGTWEQPEHPAWFPDVNAILFLNGNRTHYIQAGKPVYFSYDDNVLFQREHKQDGSRILLFGVNVQDPVINVIPYYGVLSADGKILYVDAYEYTAARLTSSFSTFEWYGPKGVTPWLIKK